MEAPAATEELERKRLRSGIVQRQRRVLGIPRVDLHALAAPRPQLLVSVTWREEGGVRAGRKDQSCNSPTVEFPYLQRVCKELTRLSLMFVASPDKTLVAGRRPARR